ncbi:MAG: acylphosphatase [bacterium]|nr:acylphosphatase [bacterium]
MKTVDTAFVKVRGRVQGVGFRYFVYKHAEKYGLSGWVKNCLDGSVEILVQGDKNVLISFLDEIKKGNPFTKITDFQIEWSKLETLNNFRIVH